MAAPSSSSSGSRRDHDSGRRATSSRDSGRDGHNDHDAASSSNQQATRPREKRHKRDLALGGTGGKHKQVWKKKKVWYCCYCSDGPMNCKIDTHCPSCGHRRDDYCTVETIDVREEP